VLLKDCIFIHLYILGSGEEELKHWQDIFNFKKEKFKNFAGKDKKKRSGGRRRDDPQVERKRYILFDLIKRMQKWPIITFIIDTINFLVFIGCSTLPRGIVIVVFVS